VGVRPAEGESLAFAPDEPVRCAVRVFYGGEQGLAALERAAANFRCRVGRGRPIAFRGVVPLERSRLSSGIVRRPQG
jgi:hypothetical protein